MLSLSLGFEASLLFGLYPLPEFCCTALTTGLAAITGTETSLHSYFADKPKGIVRGGVIGLAVVSVACSLCSCN